MPRIRYRAVTAENELIEGSLEAASRAAVIGLLRSQGHIPIKVQEQRQSPLRQLSIPNPLASRRAGFREVAIAMRELSALLRSGVPLERSLSITINVTRTFAIKAALKAALEDIRGGRTFADALDSNGRLLPTHCVGMIRASEAGGTLEIGLDHVVDTLERMQALREDIRSALRYPIVVFSLAIFSLVVLMRWVIPEFRQLFEESGALLPASTRLIIAVSEFVEVYGWALIALATVFTIVLWRLRTHRVGRIWWDRIVCRLPLIGDLVVKIEVARFSRNLGALLKSGVSILGALTIATSTIENHALAAVVGRTKDRLAKGERLTESLSRFEIFPKLALELIGVGEETGQLEKMLFRLAEIYDNEVRREVQRMLGLLTPLLTILLGVFIAFIIGSMMAAILSSYNLAL